MYLLYVMLIQHCVHVALSIVKSRRNYDNDRRQQCFRKQGHYDEIERGNVPMRPNLWYHVLVDQDPGIARQCNDKLLQDFDTAHVVPVMPHFPQVLEFGT